MNATLAFGFAFGTFAALRIWKAFIRARGPLAVFAGTVWALAFPKPGVAGLAWVAPALLCFSAAGRHGSASWRTGYLGGLTFYLISLHWLLYNPMTGEAIGGWIVLSAYMALYPATWVWLCWKWFPSPVQPSAGWRSLAESFQSVPWSRRMSWTLACASAWAGLEFLSSHLLTGFPWNLLGVSQYRLTPLIQLAAATGVWGISFLIVWFSMSLLGVASSVLAKPGLRSAWLPEIVLPIIAVATVFGVGFHQVMVPLTSRRTIKALLIQPSIPQTMIWNPSENEWRFEALVRQTQRALTNQTDLLIWPEAAIPKLLRFDLPTAQTVSDLARTNHVWMIVGSDDAEPKVDNTNEADYFNGAFLINPEGELSGTYHKQHLVMFGEYIPLDHWLPFLRWFNPIEDYQAGTQPVLFDLPSLGVRTSVLICFEDLFSQLARAASRENPDFLVNLTNDGWFGESSEQWQHAAGAVFRAVENRRPLIRCTNNGLTCWIDEFGRIRQQLDSTTHGVYGTGCLWANVEFSARHAEDDGTLYQQYGDWFAWMCVLMTALQLVAGWKWRPPIQH